MADNATSFPVVYEIVGELVQGLAVGASVIVRPEWRNEIKSDGWGATTEVLNIGGVTEGHYVFRTANSVYEMRVGR